MITSPFSDVANAIAALGTAGTRKRSRLASRAWSRLVCSIADAETTAGFANCDRGWLQSGVLEKVAVAR